MYNWEKSTREERMRRNARNPSFSSTLLDEIYRSIDGGLEKHEEFKINRERTAKKQSNNGAFVKANTGNVEDEETATLRRACLIDKLIEKKVNEKVSARRRETSPELDRKSPHVDNDPLFFSSSSSSSDSSFGGFSSSETESFPAPKLKTSCFRAAMPKQVKTTVSAPSGKSSSDDHHHQRNNEELKSEEGLNNLKLRALKIYSNLKKAKQPISPGGRLATFMNSLFTNGNAKKKTDSPRSIGVDDESKATPPSTCSSASSFSRSCLSKTSLNSGEKFNNGVKRTVRFNPVSVIVDEDSRPCGHKCIYKNDDSRKFGTSLPLRTKGRKLEEIESDFVKCYQNQKKKELVLKNGRRNGNDYDEEDDVFSDSSSDLFEIDHLALVGRNRYCEELPVYETTHLYTNRAIANGLIR
ncbi:protein BIG GRAIN 1-like B [Cornus florida]|uniref:protein BIG GRAIN 1-like B n=1 Tax=Cornus florida TaxID=4283 RepID=UPI00289BC4E6|nr:protein BIG GRAIN 1-like B [Cornus florida]